MQSYKSTFSGYNSSCSVGMGLHPYQHYNYYYRASLVMIFSTLVNAQTDSF